VAPSGGSPLEAQRATATLTRVTTEGWPIDPSDPRAPPEDVWRGLSAAVQARVYAALPSEFPRTAPPEGDPHRLPKTRALEALGEYFRRIGRGVYLGSELPVYCPGEPMFAPDLIAVLDVDPHERDRWMVSHEERGLDFAMEVTLHGDKKKDLETNVVEYARLGIPEYFVLDARTTRLLGYRLDEGERVYRPIVPQGGRWPSKVLGLDLTLEGRRVRFFHGSAALPEASELIQHLESMMDGLTSGKESAERAREESERAREESERAREESEQRAERLAAKLRELGVDPDAI
jgi:Uma2 family endonuclease